MKFILLKNYFYNKSLSLIFKKRFCESKKAAIWKNLLCLQAYKYNFC